MFAISFSTSFENGIAELKFLLKNAAVKDFSKRIRRIVVDRPSGSDHAAHADFDQLAARNDHLAALRLGVLGIA